MQAFDQYANNLLNNSASEDAYADTDAESVMLNGHTTFLMSKPEYREGIHKHRMNWIINNYTNYENVDKRPYYEYYKDNVSDEYKGTFDPPPCFYNEMIRKERRNAEQQLKEQETDEIAQHYKELATKSEFLAKYSNTKDQLDIYDQATEETMYEFEDSSDSCDDDDIDDQDTDYDDNTYNWDDWLDSEYYEENDYDY